MALINSQQTIFDVANQAKILTFFVKWPLPVYCMFTHRMHLQSGKSGANENGSKCILRNTLYFMLTIYLWCGPDPR